LAYIQDIQQFSAFSGCVQLSDWKEQNTSTVRGWMVSLLEQGLSKRTVNRKLAALRTFFKWLRKDGKLEENPMTRIQGPKGEKRLPVFVKESELDPQKVNALFSPDFEGLRNSLIVELFYQTGMRLSELIDLKDAAVTQQYIKVLGKRNKERLIPIAPELLQKINQYRVAKRALGLEHPNLLLRINGQALYPQLVYRLVKEVLGTLSGVEKRSPHVLRHTFATHMLNNGAGLETLKDLLGHANLSATQVYTHNSFAQLRKAYGSAHPRALKTP
jgi:integrase/recombinase XerC